MIYIYTHISGQIIVTSAKVTPNGGLVRESPLLAVDRVWQGDGILPIKHVTSAFRGKVFALRGCT